MRKALSFLFIGGVLVFAAGVGFLFLSPDYEAIVVQSQSMVPTFDMGDVIVTGPVNGEIQPGMIISFHEERTSGLVTHRVIGFEGGNLRTKGDATEDPDPWQVPVEAVKGVYLFRVPYLGYLSRFTHTRLGWMALIITPAVLLLMLYLKGIMFKSEPKRRRRWDPRRMR